MSGKGAYDDAPQDTGKNAYREPGEPFDGRPLVIRYRNLWPDLTEQLTYQHAAEANRRKPDEGPGEYIRRIAEMAQGKLLAPVAKEFPEVRLPYKEPEDE